MGVDETLRHRWVHVARGRLPHQDWIAVFAEMVAE
jgi:hypothetical protein